MSRQESFSKAIRRIRYETVVSPLHGLGQPGPVADWGLPVGVFGCGPVIGYQLVTVQISAAGRLWPCSWGWIYPTEADAKVALKSHRALVKKREMARKRKSKKQPPAPKERKRTRG
jgi:hypothetical protein